MNDIKKYQKIEKQTKFGADEVWISFIGEAANIETQSLLYFTHLKYWIITMYNSNH